METKLREVAPDLYQLYLPLPMRPSIVNVYLLRSGEEWALCDTGMNSEESLAAFQAALDEVDCPPTAYCTKAACGGLKTTPISGFLRSRARVVQARQRHPDKRIELWGQDEARCGQQGTHGRVWAERGSRPRIVHPTAYAWTSLFGAVCPGTGQSVGGLMSTASDLDLLSAGSQSPPGSRCPCPPPPRSG